LVCVLKQQDRMSVISTKPWFSYEGKKQNCVKLDAEQLTSLWQLKGRSIYRQQERNKEKWPKFRCLQ
jgi:hypothetical protein